MTSTHNGAGLDEDESSLAEELEAVALRKGTPPVMFAPEGSVAYQCIEGRWVPLDPAHSHAQAEAPAPVPTILTRTILPTTLDGTRAYHAWFEGDDVFVGRGTTPESAVGHLVRHHGGHAGIAVREARDD